MGDHIQKLPPKLTSCLLQPAHQRSVGQAEHVGDFLIGITGNIVQHDGFPLVRCQRIDSIPDRLAELVAGKVVALNLGNAYREKADATAIKQEVSAANENYAKMMKAGQVVSQLYHNLSIQKNEK